MFSASVDYLKVALWKQNAPIENLGLQTLLVCFADSWKVMRLLFPPPFTPGMHPLQIKSFYFGKMGNFVVRTIHIEMSFQCLVKHFHFLICSSTSFQVGICSFLFQSTAKRHSKLQRPIHYWRALISLKFIRSHLQSQPGLLQCYWWEM